MNMYMMKSFKYSTLNIFYVSQHTSPARGDLLHIKMNTKCTLSQHSTCCLEIIKR